MAVEKIGGFQNVKSKGAEIVTIASGISKLLDQVSAQMEGVGGAAWQSANASKFKSDFETLKPSFDKVFKAIDTMGQAIEASGTIHESGEIGSSNGGTGAGVNSNMTK